MQAEALITHFENDHIRGEEIELEGRDLLIYYCSKYDKKDLREQIIIDQKAQLKAGVWSGYCRSEPWEQEKLDELYTHWEPDERIIMGEEKYSNYKHKELDRTVWKTMCTQLVINPVDKDGKKKVVPQKRNEKKPTMKM